MPRDTPTSNLDPEQALLTVRIIWAVLLAGQIIIAIVFAVMIGGETIPPDPGIGGLAAMVAAGMLVVLVPIGLFVRGQVFKRGWVGDAVRPGAYMTGNIIAWSCVEATTFLGLIAALIGGAMIPYAIPAAIAVGLHILLWPNGKAMRPSARHENRNPYRQEEFLR